MDTYITGAVIKRLREEKNLTQSELAEKIGVSGKAVSKCAETKVTFRELSESEIDEYIKSGEPMDKAGAYGIQGGAGKFVTETDGEYTNVVGLPKEALTKLLKEEFTFEGR